MAHSVYLDNHTAAKPLPQSVEAMLPFFRDKWGSTTSPHQMGQELFAPIEQHTQEILALLGAKPEDRFYFFSSGAEAIHHLFTSFYFDSVRETGKNHILTTNVEEAPALLSLKKLEELGCAGKILPVDAQGQLSRAALEEHLRPRTSLLSLSWANGLTGVVQPVADLGEACRAKDVAVHVDASCVIGKIYFRFEDLPVDYLTFDGSLLHAPKGTAGLLVKEKAPFNPPPAIMTGLSAGGIAALAAALREIDRQFDHMSLETVRLRDKLEKGLGQVLFQNVERLPNVAAIAFPGCVSDAMLYHLNRKRVFATLGGGRMQRLSHILVACGMDEIAAHTALSFALSFETTEEEVDTALRAIADAAGVLQPLSGHLMGGA